MQREQLRAILRAVASMPGSAGEAYMMQRGFNAETLVRFCLGFDPRARYHGASAGRPGVIYPFSRRLDSFGVRFIDGKQPAGSADGELFNPAALWGYEWAIVVKSAFDVMAISQGLDDLRRRRGALVIKPGQGALTVGAAGRLLDELSTHPCATRLLIALDNNDAGRIEAERLAGDLESIRQPFALLDAATIYGGDMDAETVLKRGADAITDAAERILCDERARIRI